MAQPLPQVSRGDLPAKRRAASRAPVRVAVAHGWGVVCAGLEALLRNEPGFALAGVFADIRDLAGTLTAEPADVVLLGELAAGPRPALDALRAASPPPRVLLLVMPGRADGVVEALHHGAWGALPVSVSPDLLFKSIRTAAAGEAWVDRQTVTRLLEDLQYSASGAGHRRRTLSHTLTPRELDIVRSVAGGASNRDVGADLGMSAQTVKNHLSTIYDKLGVSSRLELAIYALHHGLSAADAAAEVRRY